MSFPNYNSALVYTGMKRKTAAVSWVRHTAIFHFQFPTLDFYFVKKNDLLGSFFLSLPLYLLENLPNPYHISQHDKMLQPFEKNDATISKTCIVPNE